MGKIYLYQRGRARSAEAPGAPRSARRRAYRRIAPCLARGDGERGSRSARLRRNASSRVAGIEVSREELGLGEVRLTYRARRDLIELWLAVRDVNPRAADELYKRLGARIQILDQFPEAGPLRPQLNPEARVLVEPPYLILYRIIPDGVQIWRVAHGARPTHRTRFIR